MTISAVVPDIAFAGSSGSGTMGPFSLAKNGTPIVFYNNSDIVVYRYGSVTDTAPVLLVEGTDYDLTGGPTAGSITLTSPQTGLLTAERLYVYRRSTLAQSLDLVNGGNFSAANLERRLDITETKLQELDRDLKSTIRFAMFDTDVIPGTLPLGAAIGKVVYPSGTAANPVLATLDASVLGDLTNLTDSDKANLSIVATDLAGADTIGIVAGIEDEVGTVAGAASSIVTVAGAIDDGTIGDLLDGSVSKVDTYTALKAITPTSGQVVYAAGRTTAGDGGAGHFRWISGDQSALVTADSEEGVYVPPASDATGASGVWARLHDEVMNVLWFGAVSDFDDDAMTGTDDYDAIEGARAVAEYLGSKTIYFPPGKYGLSEPVIFDGDDWTIFGVDKNCTMLVAINDDDIFQVDCRTAISYQGTIKGLCFRRRSATYSNTAAIRVLADTGSATGMRHWTIQDILLRGVAYGVWHEATALAVSAGINQISWHGFNMYLNIDVPVDVDGRYPINVLGWEGGNGPHHLVLGGQYRSEDSCIKMGNGAEFEGVGDFVMLGVHCVLGEQAVEIIGPSGASTYRFNFSITGCQFDVMNSFLLLLSDVGFFRAIGNNFLTGVNNSLTNVINYIIEGPDGIARQAQGGITDTFNVPVTFSQAITHNSSRLTQNGWLSLGAGTTATIASGAITATRTNMIVDTEGSAASDDLDTISGGADGDLVRLRTASSSRDVTVKHATGNIRLNGAADKALTSVSDTILLERIGGIWCQISFSDNFA